MPIWPLGVVFGLGVIAAGLVLVLLGAKPCLPPRH